MSKLSEQEIRQVIQKASLLQKFGESSSSFNLPEANAHIRQLFEITDDLGIPRGYVHEAYIEQAGIPLHEPIVVDNHDFNSTEVVGFSYGNLDKDLVSELKGHVEYHFNTMGKLTHRRNKLIWKAKPVGPSKLIASSSSPEVTFEEIDHQTKITVKQSLKTANKFYLPALASTFGAFMMIAYSLFFPNTSEVIPMLVVATLILTATTFYVRFINRRKRKRKENLKELTEILQSKIERHLKSTTYSLEQEEQENDGESIHLPEDENDTEYQDDEIEVNTKDRSKE